MKRFYQITLFILILLNLALVVYALNNWQNKQYAKSIPINEVISNRIIKSEMQRLVEKATNDQAVIALISLKSNNCKRVAIADLLKKVKAISPQTIVRIVLPKEFSDRDLANFKNNLEIDFEVVKEDNELSSFWQPLAEKYDALGIVIIAKDQKLFASQSVTEIKKHFESL